MSTSGNSQDSYEPGRVGQSGQTGQPKQAEQSGQSRQPRQAEQPSVQPGAFQTQSAASQSQPGAGGGQSASAGAAASQAASATSATSAAGTAGAGFATGGQQTPPVNANARNEAESHGARFFQWIRSSGLTRDDDRWIGGVCSGIARYLGWNPLLVRALVTGSVLVCGAGAVFYALAWFLLPDERDGGIICEKLIADEWDWSFTGVLLCFACSFIWAGSWFVGAVLAAAALWAMVSYGEHQRLVAVASAAETSWNAGAAPSGSAASTAWAAQADDGAARFGGHSPMSGDPKPNAPSFGGPSGMPGGASQINTEAVGTANTASVDTDQADAEHNGAVRDGAAYADAARDGTAQVGATPSPGMPPSGVPSPNTSASNVFPSNASPAGAAASNVSHNGMNIPQTGMNISQTGMPSSNVVPPDVPSPGTPASGMSESGMSESDTPGSGTSGSDTPASGDPAFDTPTASTSPNVPPNMPPVASMPGTSPSSAYPTYSAPASTMTSPYRPAEPQPKPRYARRKPAGPVVVLAAVGIIFLSFAIMLAIWMSGDGDLESLIKCCLVWSGVVCAGLGLCIVILGCLGRRSGGLVPFAWIVATVAVLMYIPGIGYGMMYNNMFNIRSQYSSADSSGLDAGVKVSAFDVIGSDSETMQRLSDGIWVEGSSINDLLHIDLSEYGQDADDGNVTNDTDADGSGNTADGTSDNTSGNAADDVSGNTTDDTTGDNSGNTGDNANSNDDAGTAGDAQDDAAGGTDTDDTADTDDDATDTDSENNSDTGDTDTTSTTCPVGTIKIAPYRTRIVITLPDGCPWSFVASENPWWSTGSDHFGSLWAATSSSIWVGAQIQDHSMGVSNGTWDGDSADYSDANELEGDFGYGDFSYDDYSDTDYSDTDYDDDYSYDYYDFYDNDYSDANELYIEIESSVMAETIVQYASQNTLPTLDEWNIANNVRTDGGEADNE